MVFIVNIIEPISIKNPALNLEFENADIVLRIPTKVAHKFIVITDFSFFIDYLLTSILSLI
jgi:hypothetical protein